VPLPAKRSNKLNTPPKHKCGKCGKYGSHSEADCHGSAFRPKAQDGAKAPPVAKSSAVIPPAKSSKNGLSATDKKDPICYNCGKSGHTVPRCGKPLKRPFAFRPEVRSLEAKKQADFSIALVRGLPKHQQMVHRAPAHPRDTFKVFIDLVAAKADKVTSIYCLLDTGASHTWISDEFAIGYQRLSSPVATFETGSLPTTCSEWVRLPISTGSRIVWIHAAVMPQRQLPQHCAALISRFDVEEILLVDLLDVKRRYLRGERLFSCKYLDDEISTAMAVEISPPGTDEDSFLEGGLAEHFASERTDLTGGAKVFLHRTWTRRWNRSLDRPEMESSWLYSAINSSLLVGYGPDSPSYQDYHKLILEDRRESSISQASKKSSKSSRFPYRRPKNVARSLQKTEKGSSKSNGHSAFLKLRRFMDRNEMVFANFSAGYDVSELATSSVAPLQKISSGMSEDVGEAFATVLDGQMVTITEALHADAQDRDTSNQFFESGIIQTCGSRRGQYLYGFYKFELLENSF